MKLEDEIRALDIAANRPDSRQRAAADRLVEEILSVPPRRQRSGHWPRFSLRTGTVLALGACAAVAMLLLPQESARVPAIATWTATAETVAPADLAIAKEACQESIAEFDLAIAEHPTSLLSERRGDLVGVMLWGADPETLLTCLVELPEGTNRAVATTGGAELGVTAAGPAAAGEVEGGNLWELKLDGGNAIMTWGAVGPDVKAVTMHIGKTAVEATVQDGRYAAWWPTSDLVMFSPASPANVITFDLTFRDGSTKTGVHPRSSEAVGNWHGVTSELVAR
ncbi:hypothetical protein [Leucobacter sp. 1207-22]|uniref:hypothetical protein n=1 Tax=Leucobacter sp. 1207-22 TaxID=2604456 RepID=UPI004064B2C2